MFKLCVVAVNRELLHNLKSSTILNYKHNLDCIFGSASMGLPQLIEGLDFEILRKN